MRKLQENPDDNDAMEQMNKAQQQLAEWNASGQAGMCYFSNDDSSVGLPQDFELNMAACPMS